MSPVHDIELGSHDIPSSRRTNTLTGPACSVSWTSQKAYMPAGSAAAPGSARPLRTDTAAGTDIGKKVRSPLARTELLRQRGRPPRRKSFDGPLSVRRDSATHRSGLH